MTLYAKVLTILIYSPSASLASNREGWAAACPPTNIFVYHTSKTTTTEDVRDAAKHFGGLDVKEVEKRSNEHALFGSFRVSIERKDFNLAMTGSSWPA